MEEVKAVEKRLTNKGCDAHLNDIARLYEFCETGDLGLLAESLQAVGRVLAFQRRREGAPPALLEWLRQHTQAFHTTLTKLATSDNARAQVCAIRLSMATIRDEAEEVRHQATSGGGGGLRLPSAERRIQDLLEELLVSERWSSHVVQCLNEEYIHAFIDVRHNIYHHLRVCVEQAGKQDWSAPSTAPAAKRRKRQVAPFADTMRSRGRTPEELFNRVFSFLSEAQSPESADTQSSDLLGALGLDGEDGGNAVAVFAPGGRPVGYFQRAYRKVFQDAWVQLLSLPVPLDLYAPVMQILPGRVMPHISQPLLLADFYLRAFHSGSLEMSVQSLSGLLLLLTRHGLGDPEAVSSASQEFYSQLYSLIKPETFKLRKRARFQRLLSASLGSGLLPARFAAVFAKKCMAIAVSCTDPGAVGWLMSVAYTLIQKHHSHCKLLLHKEQPEEGAPPLDGDPFDATAPMAKAVEQVPLTSLWEVQLLRRHYVPQISSLAKLFLRPFFKPTARKLDPEVFLDQSFERMFQQAMKTGEKQASKMQAKGEKCPVSFKLEDNELASKVFGWAAALSTEQRKLGANV